MRLRLALATLIAAVVFPAFAADDIERREEGALVFENIPAIPAELRDRLRQYDNTRSAPFLGWTPDGEAMLVATRFGETGQLHLVDHPLGARRQITFEDDPVASGAFPRTGDENLILYSKAEAGTEKDQVWLHDLRTGRARLLTDGESVNRGEVWSNGSMRFAFCSTRRNGADWDIYVQDAADSSNEATRVLEETGMWYPLDWSRDDARLLVGKFISANETHLEVLTLATGGRVVVDAEPSDEPVARENALFARDGRGVFFTSDRASEFQTLRHWDLATGRTREVLGGIGWDISAVASSNDGKRLAVVTNENGIDRLRLVDAKSFKAKAVDLPTAAIQALEFSPDDKRIGLGLYPPTSAGDSFSYDIRKKKLARWTASEVGGLPTDSFRGVETFDYPTFDDRRIPAYVMKPEGKSPFPVVIEIHGGPEGQAVPTFNSFHQFLANELGVATICPNVRGSSGYGKSYLKLDNGRLREDSVKDIGALLDWIATQPDLDASRVVVMGGSYGGYMVLASMAHYGDRLVGGIDSVGISNFVTFLESTSEYRRDQRRAEYGDERDPEMRAFLQSISPTTTAERIRKPLFVVQGKNDPRVPFTEAEQIVREVRANGVPVWYLLATNEGHGFARKENRDEYRAAAALFLQRCFAGEMR